MKTNTLYYFGDVNPECGGVVCRKLENGSIDAWYIGEFSPINFCTFIHEIHFDDDKLENASIEDIEEMYFNGDVAYDSSNAFYFMKAIDKEMTNASNLNLIDKFVRYDYNVWNVIKQHVGVTRHTKIHTYNGSK